jgi:hypothetical protein
MITQLDKVLLVPVCVMVVVDELARTRCANQMYYNFTGIRN